MKKIFLIFLSILVCMQILTMPANAQEPTPPEKKPAEVDGVSLDSEGINAKLPPNLPRLGLENETQPVRLVEKVMLNYVINPIFFIAAGAAVIMIMYSSFRIISARGEEEGLTSAKNTLIWAAVGLLLVLLAFTLVRNVAKIILDLI